MGVTATARAKLLLFGEHAAVYGHPAVGLSLPWRLTVTYRPGPRWELPDLGPYEASVRQLVDLYGQIARDEGLDPPVPGHLDFTNQMPIGNGFGSSGALCAALVNLFFPELPLTAKDRLAWRGEGLFHGTPSGIDTALSLRSGWSVLDPSTRPVTATPLPDPNLVLVVGSVVRTSDTRRLVESLARRKQSGDRIVTEALDHLGAVSDRAIEALRARRPERLPGLVTQARTALCALDLETPVLTAALEAGLGCPGALAAKLSGAGGGGAFYLLFADGPRAEASLSRIERAVSPDQWTCPPRVIFSEKNTQEWH